MFVNISLVVVNIYENKDCPGKFFLSHTHQTHKWEKIIYYKIPSNSKGTMGTDRL